MKRTQLLWETNKLSDTEARLHHSEQDRAKVKQETTKLRLRLQETAEQLTEAQNTCRQLEGEKELLEEQIKSRGRRTAEQARRQSQIASRATSVPVTSSSRQGSSLGEELSEGKLQSVNPQEKGDMPPKENVAPTQRKKEINLLEELEREFSQEERKGGDKKPLTSHNDSPLGSVTSQKETAKTISNSTKVTCVCVCVCGEMLVFLPLPTGTPTETHSTSSIPESHPCEQ